MRLFANADYPFLQWRRRAYLVAGLLIALGLGAMIYNAATIGSWLNYGIDFQGGTLVQVQFQQPTTVEEIRRVNPQWEIARLGGEAGLDEFVIRMPTFSEEIGDDAAAQLSRTLAGTFGEGAFEVVRTEAVGPKVGAELQQRALLAILISFVLTLVYLAFRFEWRFGVAAIIATLHDIVVTLGLLALFRNEISVGTVAAFLTIVGYSLNDTIIVFDRIRENVAKRARGVGFEHIVDRAINETLPRTVLTTGSTLATLYALYMFGGVVIRDFAQVLILGIALGTFSSVFVAAPALYNITKRWPPVDKKLSGAAVGRRREAAV
jgi:preprotein translocase subunit SecF